MKVKKMEISYAALESFIKCESFSNNCTSDAPKDIKIIGVEKNNPTSFLVFAKSDTFKDGAEEYRDEYSIIDEESIPYFTVILTKRRIQHEDDRHEDGQERA